MGGCSSCFSPNNRNSFREDLPPPVVRKSPPKVIFSQINKTQPKTQFTDDIARGERTPLQVTVLSREIKSTIAFNDNFNRDELALKGIKKAIARPSRRIQRPQKSSRNQQLFNLFGFGSIEYSSTIVSYIPLSNFEAEYLRVTKMITNKRNFKVDSIEKIVNPYLEKAYELKKSQKENEFFFVQERLLFHGTKRAYVDEICEKNFNWRMCRTHKYGKGISFSPNSTYSSNYSDKNVYNKVMLVARVMIGKSCIGDENMVLPPQGYDTTQKGNNGIVIVKYEDNEFYPVYRINYHLMNESMGKRPTCENQVRYQLRY